MKITLLTTCFLLTLFTVIAQKQEGFLNYSFKPTEGRGRYYAVTEKKDTLWHRQAWYLPEQTKALDAWYKDADAKVPHGVELWYHTTRYLKSSGRYINGLKEGPWVEYNEDGRIKDSANYAAGRLKGVRLKWNSDGYLVDSTEFDGAGNGVEVTWYTEGEVYSAGRWILDTVKNGRWQYFHRNGQLLATEDYKAGEKVACACYDEAGVQLDSALCVEKEASFKGGEKAWSKFLEDNLRPDVPIRLGAPAGQYTVRVQFVVDKEGSVADIKALTKYGYGMEEEVIRMMKRSPRWVPANQFGRKVKAYRIQPVTFVLSNR